MGAEVGKLVLDAARSTDEDVRRAAFGKLVVRYQNMVYGYAYAVLGDFHMAEDAAQSAFAVAWRRIATLRHPEAFTSWLRRIAFTVCEGMGKARGNWRSLDESPDLETPRAGPEAAVLTRELQQQVQRAIRQLPPAQREATTLFHINGYSQKDIAEFLDVPVSTVKNRLHISRKRLKERMMVMVEQTLKSNALPEDFRLGFDSPSRTHTTSPSLVFFQDRWVMVWQDGEAWEPYDGPFWFLLSTSRDGRTWSGPKRLPLEPQWQCAPKLAVLGDALLLHTHHHHQGVRIARSTDLKEWDPGQVLPLGDIGRSHIFTGERDIYLVYPRWRSVKVLGDSVELLHTTDGRFWEWLPSPLPPRNSGLTDASGIRLDDRIVVFWREHPYNETVKPLTVHVRSGRDGRNWGRETELEAFATDEGSFLLQPARLSDGTLVLAQDVHREDGNCQIMLAFSQDGGKTWPPEKVRTVEGFSDPAVAIAQDGTLLLAGSMREPTGSSCWVIHSRLERISRT